MSRAHDIAIVGAGGLGREIQAALANDPGYNFVGFYDDNFGGTRIDSHIQLGNVEDAINNQRGSVLIGIGDPVIKSKIAERLEGKVTYDTFIHRMAWIEQTSSVVLGEGAIVCAGTQITCDVKIGLHVLLNLNVTIGHDVIIGDHCSLMPGSHISGDVNVGANTLIGSGAEILQGISIGENCQIGAGAVVTKDVPANTTVVGVPARPISK